MVEAHPEAATPCAGLRLRAAEEGLVRAPSPPIALHLLLRAVRAPNSRVQEESEPRQAMGQGHAPPGSFGSSAIRWAVGGILWKSVACLTPFFNFTDSLKTVNLCKYSHTRTRWQCCGFPLTLAGQLRWVRVPDSCLRRVHPRCFEAIESIHHVSRKFPDVTNGQIRTGERCPEVDPSRSALAGAADRSSAIASRGA